jgi:hypothetical protein
VWTKSAGRRVEQAHIDTAGEDQEERRFRTHQGHRGPTVHKTSLVADLSYLVAGWPRFMPGTEVETYLLSFMGELFKKANKWLRSPSFKVGHPRPSPSAFAYMVGP